MDNGCDNISNKYLTSYEFVGLLECLDLDWMHCRNRAIGADPDIFWTVKITINLPPSQDDDKR